ncbi:MAG: YraN family protein [Chloroflexi bacterium]|nr:YraN family protein [Chloroflexota bacterium]MYB83726.1 YraN family protein [Chloroflexota bacterium]
MPSPRSKLGAQGERIAGAHLESLGLVIETRNFRTRFGEIDIVARDGVATVFVEVRTKRSTAYGTPEESLTPRKQARLVRTAQQYLAEHGRAGSSWRVDLVAITLQPDGPAHIVHVESAVEASGE